MPKCQCCCWNCYWINLFGQHLFFFSIIEFETQNEARKAIRELTNTMLDGRMIFVREDREDNQKTNNQFFEGSKYLNDTNSNAQLFIKNLPFSTSWQDLKDYFKPFGFVARAEIFPKSRWVIQRCGDRVI